MREFYGCLDVDALQHPITPDVGVNNRVHAVVLVFFCQIRDLMPRDFAPTIGGHFTVFGIQTNDDLPAKSDARLLQKSRVFHSGCANDDVRNPHIEIFFNGFEVTNPTTDLHGNVIANGV